MFPLPETVTHLPGLFVTYVSGLYLPGKEAHRTPERPLLASPEYGGGKKLPGSTGSLLLAQFPAVGPSGKASRSAALARWCRGFA